MTRAAPYESFDDPYCYENSMVLKNLAGIDDAQILEDFELEMTALRAEEALPDGLFDAAHYCALHHQLF